MNGKQTSVTIKILIGLMFVISVMLCYYQIFVLHNYEVLYTETGVPVLEE